jgi:TRAP-type C4-dicarboxylate transport system substrate-binding protein
VLVQQLPGIVTDWAKLDKVRAAVGPELEKGFDLAGFKILGWGDVGLVRQFTKGFAIKGPGDVKGKRPVVWRNEPMGPIIYATIGGVVPVPAGPIEVLPALRSGQVNIVNAPALAAEQLQWAPQLDHVGTNVSVCAVGGTVFRKQSLDALPADVKKDFDDLQAKMASRDTHRIRKLDDEAFGRVSQKMTVVNLSDAEKAEWKVVLDKAVQRIRQGTFDPALVDKVIAAAK